MAAENGGRSVWFTVAMAVISMIIGLGAGVVRGDWLGSREATLVEQRLEKRIEQLESDYRSIMNQLAEIKGLLRQQRRD